MLQCACIFYASSKRTNFVFLSLIKVVGKGKIIIWFYQLRIMYIGHWIEFLKLIFQRLPLHHLLWWRAWNVSFKIYYRYLWQINVTNPVYKTKLSGNIPSLMQTTVSLETWIPNPLKEKLLHSTIVQKFWFAKWTFTLFFHHLRDVKLMESEPQWTQVYQTPMTMNLITYTWTWMESFILVVILKTSKQQFLYLCYLS